MEYISLDSVAFPPEREARLRAIFRYSMFDVMLYRSNLWEHSHRVTWIVEELAPLTATLKGYDIEKARALAYVHDDPEMLVGDIQAGHKAKMTKQELEAIESNEDAAADALSAQMSGTVNGYGYRELLGHAIHKDCIEAQVVSYADKFDAYCETLHELFAGNLSLLWSILLYERWTTSYPQKYPEIAELLSLHDFPFVIANTFQQPSAVHAAHFRHPQPHTRDSIAVPTEFPYYNSWRTMVAMKGGEEGITWLTTARESLP